METDMQKFYIVYVIWSVAAAFPLIAAVICGAVHRASMGKFAKGFATGFITYALEFLIAALLLRTFLMPTVIALFIPVLLPLLLAAPIFALLLAFAAMMVYYNALFKKISSPSDALSVSLGLFCVSFLACIVFEKFNMQSLNSYLAAYETVNGSTINISMPGRIFGTIAAAVIKAGLSSGAAIAVYFMYAPEKMNKRGAAKASSAIMGVLTVGFDLLILL